MLIGARQWQLIAMLPDYCTSLGLVMSYNDLVLSVSPVLLYEASMVRDNWLKGRIFWRLAAFVGVSKQPVGGSVKVCSKPIWRKDTTERECVCVCVCVWGVCVLKSKEYKWNWKCSRVRMDRAECWWKYDVWRRLGTCRPRSKGRSMLS